MTHVQIETPEFLFLSLSLCHSASAFCIGSLHTLPIFRRLLRPFGSFPTSLKFWVFLSSFKVCFFGAAPNCK
ncbi:hypothetical protein RIF29_22216 [Crotalaria pallida]|uniref:Uncharacterized protein n=1 Tax=Crotalaria pallida TaxID=3830 RepID=A0AAN9IE85_CROPI